MTDEPKPGKARPTVRAIAGLGYLVFIALGILLSPLGGYEERPWQLATPLGAVVGAAYCGRIALIGRAPRWP